MTDIFLVILSPSKQTPSSHFKLDIYYHPLLTSVRMLYVFTY
jgi:hypothetical protein